MGFILHFISNFVDPCYFINWDTSVVLYTKTKDTNIHITESMWLLNCWPTFLQNHSQDLRQIWGRYALTCHGDETHGISSQLRPQSDQHKINASPKHLGIWHQYYQLTGTCHISYNPSLLCRSIRPLQQVGYHRGGRRKINWGKHETQEGIAPVHFCWSSVAVPVGPGATLCGIYRAPRHTSLLADQYKPLSDLHRLVTILTGREAYLRTGN